MRRRSHPTRVSPAWGLVLLGAVLGGCSFDVGGQGTTTVDLGDGPGSTGATEGTPMTAGEDDPSLTGPDSGQDSAPTSDDSATDTSATESDSGAGCPGGCPANWVCEAPECVNPDEDVPCGAGCGPAAPFCGPDGICHDGSMGDPCSRGQCVAPLMCGPHQICQAGVEGDACLDASDCGATAPICFNSTCQDGSEGDPCSSEAQCLPGWLCGPTNACQDGSEGDPCAGPEDCGPGAPYCPYDDQCHDGSTGDPCDDASQCDVFTESCSVVFGQLVCGL